MPSRSTTSPNGSARPAVGLSPQCCRAAHSTQRYWQRTEYTEAACCMRGFGCFRCVSFPDKVQRTWLLHRTDYATHPTARPAVPAGTTPSSASAARREMPDLTCSLRLLSDSTHSRDRQSDQHGDRSDPDSLSSHRFGSPARPDPSHQALRLHRRSGTTGSSFQALQARFAAGCRSAGRERGGGARNCRAGFQGKACEHRECAMVFR